MKILREGKPLSNISYYGECNVCNCIAVYHRDELDDNGFDEEEEYSATIFCPSCSKFQMRIWREDTARGTYIFQIIRSNR